MSHKYGIALSAFAGTIGAAALYAGAGGCFGSSPFPTCAMYSEPPDGCPDTIVSGGTCPNAVSSSTGLSASTPVTLNCNVVVSVPTPDGECYNYPQAPVWFVCNTPSGTPCPA